MNFQSNEELLEVYVWAQYKGRGYKITGEISITDEGMQITTKKIDNYSSILVFCNRMQND